MGRIEDQWNSTNRFVIYFLPSKMKNFSKVWGIPWLLRGFIFRTHFSLTLYSLDFSNFPNSLDYYRLETNPQGLQKTKKPIRKILERNFGAQERPVYSAPLGVTSFTQLSTRVILLMRISIITDFSKHLIFKVRQGIRTICQNVFFLTYLIFIVRRRK